MYGMNYEPIVYSLKIKKAWQGIKPAKTTPSSVYKELAYKEFFWPVLKVLADLRKLSTESFFGKEFSKTEKPKTPQTVEF